MENEPPPFVEQPTAEPPVAEPPAAEQPLVDIQRLTVFYGKQLAVNNLSLTIPRGEVFGFIGPNGAGKTTTIKVLATLLKPSFGSVRVMGIDVTASPQKVRRNIGYVPDSFGVYEDLSVVEYLHFFAAAYRIEREKRAGTVMDVLALTDLSDKAGSQVDALSRGMKQRLGIARILLHDPQLLLLDEPASGLDPRARIEMMAILQELQRLGKTIIISSHILSELQTLCNRVAIIEKGRLIYSGPVQGVRDQVSQGRVIWVRVSSDQTQAIDLLKARKEVAEVSAADGEIKVTLAGPDIEHSIIADILVHGGAKLIELREDEIGLEEVFMRVTRGETQ